MRLFKKSIPVGIAFGVVRVRISGSEFEIATFRKDGLYIDGRRPENVDFSTAEQDVQRRDFTINGLLCDPSNCEILDYVSGLPDINKRIIRAIGNPEARFSEDRLRIIRAVRFASRFSFVIENETWNAVRKYAHQITMVSMERINAEITRILNGKNPLLGIRLLADSGILRQVIPELNSTDKIIKLYENFKASDISAAMSVLLVDIPQSVALEILKRMKFTNKVIEEFRFIKEKSEIAAGFRDLPVSGRKRLLRENLFEKLMLFLKILADSGYFDAGILAEISAHHKMWTKDHLMPEPLINGDDLKALGLKQGRIYSEILRKVEDAQLDGKIKNREEAMELVMNIIPALK
jgi:poly(A) polymerase